MQINPHFLYNTLDIIRWEVMYEANGESNVTRMIEQFSKLCRLGMKAGGKDTILMEESLEHAKAYVDVINFRHQEKIQFVTKVEDAAKQCYVPQFMLQPILENAVVHGFCDASEGYEIRISAKVEESDQLHYFGAGQWERNDGRRITESDKYLSEKQKRRKRVLAW